MIINGGIECGHGSEKPQAINRQNYYRKFAEYFKVSCFFKLNHFLCSTFTVITRQLLNRKTILKCI